MTQDAINELTSIVDSSERIKWIKITGKGKVDVKYIVGTQSNIDEFDGAVNILECVEWVKEENHVKCVALWKQVSNLTVGKSYHILKYRIKHNKGQFKIRRDDGTTRWYKEDCTMFKN